MEHFFNQKLVMYWRKYFLLPFAGVSCSLFFSSFVWADAPGEHTSPASEFATFPRVQFTPRVPGKPTPTPAPAEEVEEKPYKGFRRMKRDLEDMCEFLKLDGRAELLYRLADARRKEKNISKTTDSFLKIIRRECKPRLFRSSRDDDEKVYKQREPNVMVLDQASRIFRELAAEKEFIEQIYEAVSLLIEDLREEEGKTAAERDYADILAAFIESPFTWYKRKLAAEKRSRRQIQGNEREFRAPTPTAEDFFE